jgi:hypothetical protein
MQKFCNLLFQGNAWLRGISSMEGLWLISLDYKTGRKVTVGCPLIFAHQPEQSPPPPHTHTTYSVLFISYPRMSFFEWSQYANFPSLSRNHALSHFTCNSHVHPYVHICRYAYSPTQSVCRDKKTLSGGSQGPSTVFFEMGFKMGELHNVGQPS